jgi:hypothetical protein
MDNLPQRVCVIQALPSFPLWSASGGASVMMVERVGYLILVFRQPYTYGNTSNTLN